MNENDKLATQQILRHYQIECGPVSAIQKDILESSIEHALTTVRKDAREAVWQPIETAPKDGTDVLLWIPDGREIPIAGRWEPLVVSRKVKWVVDGGMLEDRFPLPTHWMPLLKPPAAANDEGGGGDG